MLLRGVHVTPHHAHLQFAREWLGYENVFKHYDLPTKTATKISAYKLMTRGERKTVLKLGNNAGKVAVRQLAFPPDCRNLMCITNGFFAEQLQLPRIYRVNVTIKF